MAASSSPAVTSAGNSPFVEIDGRLLRLGTLIPDIDVDGIDIADRDRHEARWKALFCGLFGGRANAGDDACGNRAALQIARVVSEKHGQSLQRLCYWYYGSANNKDSTICEPCCPCCDVRAADFSFCRPGEPPLRFSPSPEAKSRPPAVWRRSEIVYITTTLVPISTRS